MVNVNIIEGNEDAYDRAYEEVKQYFLQPRLFQNKEIADKYGLTTTRVGRMKKRVCKELGVTFIDRIPTIWALKNKKGD